MMETATGQHIRSETALTQLDRSRSHHGLLTSRKTLRRLHRVDILHESKSVDAKYVTGCLLEEVEEK